MTNSSTSKKPQAAPAVPQPADSDQSRTIQVMVKEGQDPKVETAKLILGPHIFNANAIKSFGKGSMGGDLDLMSIISALSHGAALVNDNDLKQVEAMLMSQATALNAVFGELAARSARNLAAGYLPAGETYFKMAAKAQNQCRMTLETLSTIKNPPVFARQANINNGGQQQVNNGPQPRAPARENENTPNELLALERGNDQRMDTGAQGTASGGYPPMEALAELNGAADHGGQG